MPIENFKPEYFLLLLSIFVFTISFFVLSRIRVISLKFDLIDTPNYRSSHQKSVPTFGGIAFYISILFTLFLTQKWETGSVIITLATSFSIIFFTGLKDDSKNITPRMKLLGQLISVGILMFYTEFRITTLHGFLGIEEIHPLISVLLSVFLLIGLINAYNLIDGIDGMASVIGIVITTTFGLLFYSLELYFYLGICVCLLAMILSFLRYNFSSRKKIFMGDTGSLLVGLVLGMLTMRLLSLDIEPVSEIIISRKELPLFLLSVLLIPALDIVRVIFIRFINNKGVFSADRKHIHHVLVDVGLTHKKASITMGIVNILIVIMMFNAIRYFGLLASSFLLFLLILLILYSFSFINKKVSSQPNKNDEKPI
ncbi:glycosyltransferase family 4 protein [Polaribacter sp.]|uniref:glycosyltransferase family 4 protein n=1 Tax=Polaribacter sp. TaxID=1920175 RepID=UPI003F69DF00